MLKWNRLIGEISITLLVELYILANLQPCIQNKIKKASEIFPQSLLSCIPWIGCKINLISSKISHDLNFVGLTLDNLALELGYAISLLLVDHIECLHVLGSLRIYFLNVLGLNFQFFNFLLWSKFSRGGRRNLCINIVIKGCDHLHIRFRILQVIESVSFCRRFQARVVFYRFTWFHSHFFCSLRWLRILKRHVI